VLRVIGVAQKKTNDQAYLGLFRPQDGAKKLFCRNFGWRWPQGLIHYVEHGVKPSEDFMAFITREASELKAYLCNTTKENDMAWTTLTNESKKFCSYESKTLSGKVAWWFKYIFYAAPRYWFYTLRDMLLAKRGA
jgi:hypothetical protein